MGVEMHHKFCEGRYKANNREYFVECPGLSTEGYFCHIYKSHVSPQVFSEDGGRVKWKTGRSFRCNKCREERGVKSEKKCTKCEGNGFISAYTGKAIKWECSCAVTCPRCKGTGREPEERA